MTASGDASDFKSSTMRTSVVDSSRTSTTWGSRFAWTSDPMCSTSLDLFWPYGTLVSTTFLRRPVSTSHVARTFSEPEPVS